MTKDTVVVIGAGWAGMAAARMLRADGCRVRLMERLHYPGGRAFSFVDRQMHRPLDNGQHVLLGCCTEMSTLMSSIGEGDAVRFQPVLELPVYARGRWSYLRSQSYLPGPLHLLPSLLRYHPLRWSDRLRALYAGHRMTDSRSVVSDDMSFGDWLRGSGQSSAIIENLWDLIGVSVLNCRADQVSAKQALDAFQLGVVAGGQQARIGVFAKPLGAVAWGFLRTLRDDGVAAELGRGVDRLLVEEGRIAGVVSDGEVVHADHVVAAVPPGALLSMLPDPWPQHHDFRAISKLGWNGIMNWYVEFSQPIWTGALAAAANEDGPFIFNRGRLLDPGGPDDGRLIAISLSDVKRQAVTDSIGTKARLKGLLREMFPQVESTTIVAERLVYQPHATFRAEVGSGAGRLAASSPIAGLFLAGDWTDTGWPASLEGAVRSGQAAARGVRTD